MTDAELRDEAVKELKLTTAGWRKSNGNPNYPSGVAPPTTHWGKAMALLEQIGVAPEPEPEPEPEPGPEPVPGVSPPVSIDKTGATDVTAALLSWLRGLPSGTTVSFPSDAVYRIDGTLLFERRQGGLILEGNGCTFRSLKPMTTGNWNDGQRAMWRFVECTGIVFRNMTLDGAYTKGGVHDTSLQWAHAIDLRGSHCDVSNVTMTDLAGDGVFFGLNYFDETGRSSGSVRDCTIQRIGRNAVSMTATNDCTVERVTTDAVGYTTFDVEPDLIGPGDGSTNILIQDNKVGSYFLYAFAIIESAPNVDIRFLGNTGTSSKGLRMGMIDPANKAIRPQRVSIVGNMASSPTQSPAIEARNVDSLTVTGNTLPTNILLQHSGVTNLVFSGNAPNTKSP